MDDTSPTDAASPDTPGGDLPADTPVSAVSSWKRRNWRKLTLMMVILVPVLLFAGWTALTLDYAFSTGERAGYAQKLSKRGWLCKTWEGELAMVNLPGAMPEIFRFSVRSDSIAHVV